MGRTPKPTSSAAKREDSDEERSSSSDNPRLSQTQSNNSLQSLNEMLRDPELSYTLPQWLVPERYKDKQSSQNVTQTRIFTIPLQGEPAKTQEAVRNYLMKHDQQTSGTKDSERKLKELKLEEKQATAKAKAAKDKLADALYAKSEKMKEIRKTHDTETLKAMEELEAKIRKEEQEEELKIQERIKKECKLEYQKKFKEELAQKRKREEEEDEKEAAAAASAAKKAKEDKEVAEAEAKNSTDGDGIAGDDTTKPDESAKKIAELEKKQEGLQQEMEKLSEKKREFYWLLKQVIKQETLQKMKMKKAEAK